MWDPFWIMGLKPQQPHYAVVCPFGGNQNSSWVPKACFMKVEVMWYGLIHVPIHWLWGLYCTLFVFGIDVGTILSESIASITELCRDLLPGRYLDSIFGGPEGRYSLL